MKRDRPILFSAPMVRAIFREIEQPGTGKTQTRRVGKMRPGVMMDDLEWSGPPGTIRTGRARREHIAVPYAVGDRLYVREAWATEAAYDDLSPSAMGGEEPIRYDADGAHQSWGYPAISRLGRFRQGMHMPRWASRITLIVSDVRVQRLQEISEADAIAEGCPGRLGPNPDFPDEWDPSPAEEYRDLWNSLNDDRGYGWEANPWVVAITFDPKHGNIDQIAGGA